MFKLAGRSRVASYIVVLVLVTTVASGPMLLPAPPLPLGTAPISSNSSTKPSPDELKERKTKEALAAQDRLSKILEGHKAKQTAIELLAPYWRERDGFASTIVINNTFIRSVSVTPVLFLTNGRELICPPVTLEAHASINVPVKDLIGRYEGEGQMVLRYIGEMLEINAVMVIQNPRKSLVVDHPFELASDYSTTDLEGVFYLPTPSSKVEIALSNSGGTSVDVDLGFTTEGEASNRNPGNRAKNHIKIAPHQTELVNARPNIANMNSSRAVRVTLVSTGTPGQLLTQGMVTDNDGFSANVRLQESSMLIGGKLFSPLLPIAGSLSPIVLLSNPGPGDVSVELEAYYTLNGEVEDRTLYDASVIAGEAVHVDLEQSIRALVPRNAKDVGLSISYGPHGSRLMADVLLIDRSGSGVYQVSPKGYNSAHSHYDHGFPFRIADAEDTIVTLANPSETDNVKYTLHLFYEGKTYTYTGTSLRPGEVRYLDIKKLRDEKVPGQFKEIMPANITSGEVTLNYQRPKTPSVSIAGHEQHSSDYTATVDVPFASATIFDLKGKRSYSTCAGCTPPEQYDHLLWDDAGDSGGYDWLYVYEFVASGEGRPFYITIFDTNGAYNLDAGYVGWDSESGIGGWGSGSTQYVGKNDAGYQEIGATLDLFDIYCPCGDSYGWAYPRVTVGVDAYSVGVSASLEDDDITVTLTPGHSGTLTIYYDKTEGDPDIIYSEVTAGSSSPYHFPFNFSALSEAEFTQIRVAWITTQQTAAAAGKLLGHNWDQSLYNTPAESNCTGGTEDGYVTQYHPTNCVWDPVTMKTQFMNQINSTGTGSCTNCSYGNSAVIWTNWARNQCKLHATPHRDYTPISGPGDVTSCPNNHTVNNTTVAYDPDFSSLGLACGKKVRIEYPSNGPKYLKTLTDHCPGCGSHRLDNFTTSDACSPNLGIDHNTTVFLIN